MRDVQLTVVQPILEQLAALATPRPGGPITDQEGMLRLRGDLRKLLVGVRTDLGRHVTEREAYLVLFPLVVNLDEVVQLGVIDSERLSWPMLQKDLFDTDRGGQLFYEALDEILEGHHVSPFLYQVYYFCLGLGFRGQLVGREDRVVEYQKKLLHRFPEVPAAPVAPAPDEAGQIGHVRSPLWYYLPAGAVVVCAYLVITALAGRDEDALKRDPPRTGGAAALIEGAPRLRVVAWSTPAAPASQPVAAPAALGGLLARADCPAPVARCDAPEPVLLRAPPDDDEAPAATAQLDEVEDDDDDDDTIVVEDEPPTVPPRSTGRRNADFAARLRAAVHDDDDAPSALQSAAFTTED